MELLEKFLQSKGVSTDTRTLNKGDMFFALSGPNFNGNIFASKALELGASYCVGDDASLVDASDTRVILVEDTLLALQDLARSYRETLHNTTIIGLTGSNGKTTTKELLYHVLKSKYNVYCTQGNLNNHIGVPLTILRTPQDAGFLVLEMGANHQGEIDALCKIANPDCGFITNIGKAHLEGFGGIEGVKKGKSELYKHLASSGKVIFINEEDRVLHGLLPKMSKIASFKLSDYKTTKRTPITLSDVAAQYETHLNGDYNIPNIAIAIEVGKYFNLTSDLIKEGLKSYIPASNRSELIAYRNKVVIKDAYNANPTSMRSSVESFVRNYMDQGAALILGDMFELGDEAFGEHQLMVNFIVGLGIKTTFIGRLFFEHYQESERLSFYQTVDDFLKREDITSWSERFILIKGSRGMKLEQILI